MDSFQTSENKADRADALTRLARYDEAERFITEWLRQSPDSALAHSCLARVYLVQGMYDKCMASCAASLALDPDFVWPVRAQGIALFYQGKLDDALEKFDRACSAEPNKAESYIYRARVYIKKARQAKDQNPYFTIYRKRLMEATNQAGDNLKKAMELEPSEPDGHYWLALLALIHDDESYAETCVRKALHTDPEMSEAHYLLGAITENRGDAAGAGDHYLRAGQLDPIHSNAPAKLKEYGQRYSSIRMDTWLASQTGCLIPIGLFAVMVFVLGVVSGTGWVTAFVLFLAVLLVGAAFLVFCFMAATVPQWREKRQMSDQVKKVIDKENKFS